MSKNIIRGDNIAEIWPNISRQLEIKINIVFARGGAHLPIAHALRLLSTKDEIEIEKK